MSLPFSADALAELLAPPGEAPLRPTPEQRAVIESPLGRATLVVAGAGSGKTETMASRVLWLVANGLLRAEDVLGLTFTRKAAGELGLRIRARLVALEAALRRGRPGETGELAEHIDRVLADLEDGLSLPEVSTYNSFASAIVSEFGPAAGLPVDATLIDEATAWRLARRVVTTSRDPELVTAEHSVTALTGHVLGLDRAMSEHLTRPGRVSHLLEEFRGIARLPYNDRVPALAAGGKQYKAVTDALAATGATPLLVRLAERYAEEKQQRGLIEFSDQLRLALETVRRVPAAAETLRRRHRAVLLDEYQDTSVGQTRLLAELFGGGSVMAVGDPHQSIYGWRGASSDNLAAFPRAFRARGADAPPAETLSLSVSWRNAERVLDAANVIAGPLRQDSAVAVAELLPRPGAPAGIVTLDYPETLQEEAAGVAAWFAERRGALAATGPAPTAALIFRNRGHMPRFAQALADAGVPHRIIGLGGLLSTPEVTDLVAALRCLWFAEAGSELIRLLAGPRFAVGVADIAALREAARWFAERDSAHQRLREGERGEDRPLADPDREVTLIDALDELLRLREGHVLAGNFTPAGFARLREAGGVLAGLRARIGLGLPELVRAAELALRLDIEVMANERGPHAGGAGARGNLDAFHELVEQFARVDDEGSLPSLLAWLERATAEDEHAEHAPEPDPDSVQLITAHGSKGLEWDLVAVPRLVEGEFPGTTKEGKGWLRAGVLPDELRGDAASRPVLDWRLCGTQKEFIDELAGYTAAIKDAHAAEERRLAYVALTRARAELRLSGSFWGGQSKARGPSSTLLELAEAGIVPEPPAAPASEENPLLGSERTLRWPLDPLGSRRGPVLAAADRIRAAVGERREAGAAPAALDATVRLLLAERDRGREDLGGELRTERVNASAYHDVLRDPALAARRLRRPMPQQPFRQTRVGTAFHEWVERRSATPIGTALALDFASLADPAERDPAAAAEEAAALAGAGDGRSLAEELAPLIRVFEASPWAVRAPEAVELEVSVPFAGRRLVCKIDAVYRDGEDYEIVDWKAGRAPANDEERAARFLQLDLYRAAFSAWRGIDPERVRVVLFYVQEGLELRNEHPLPVEELERRWLAATGG